MKFQQIKANSNKYCVLLNDNEHISKKKKQYVPRESPKSKPLRLSQDY